MTTAEIMPALFIGHGNPMNAIEDTVYARAWRDAAAAMPRPEAVLCISAHWETEGTFVTAMAQRVQARACTRSRRGPGSARRKTRTGPGCSGNHDVAGQDLLRGGCA